MELTIGSSLSYFLGGRKSALYLFGFLQALVLLYVVFYYSDYIWYAPLVLLSIVYFWYSLKYPLLWLGTAILLHIPLFLQRTEQITASEVLIGLYVVVPVGIWFYRKLFVERTTVLLSASDKFFMAFFVLCLLSVILTVINEFEISRWAREMLMYVGYLLYFPIRDIVRKRKQLWVIFIPFLALAFAIAVQNVLQYRTGAAAARYLWEIFAARKTAHEPLFLAVIIASAAYMLHVYKWRWKIVLAALVAAFAVALAVTFSRGYWVGTLLAFVIMFLLVDAGKKVNLLFYIALLGAVFIGGMFIFLSGLAEYVFKMISTRLISASTVVIDPSLRNRITETTVIFRHIQESPVVGYGLGATFSFFDSLIRMTRLTDYAHNAYLYLWFKLGILGLITFLGAYFLKLREGFRTQRLARDPLVKALLLSIVCILSVMLLVSITSPQFYARDSILIIALGWGLIDASRAYLLPAELTRGQS